MPAAQTKPRTRPWTTHSAATARGRASRSACCALACGVLAAGLAGCTYERVIRSNQPLAGLPGAEGGVRAPMRFDGAGLPGIPAQTYILHEDGRIELLTHSVSTLLLHIRGVLEEDNAEMLVEQLLSERTIEEFRSRGLDPGDAFGMLKARERDFYALAARLPAGESTPGALMHKIGDRVYRVELSGLAARDLAWRGVDVISERGEWKLRWFR